MATTSEVQVTKAFQHQEMHLSTHKEPAARTEVAYDLLDGMNRLAMGTILSMVLQPFSSLAEHDLHTYTLPPPRWAHVDCQ